MNITCENVKVLSGGIRLGESRGGERILSLCFEDGPTYMFNALNKCKINGSPVKKETFSGVFFF